jgi:hypothetical protein
VELVEIVLILALVVYMIWRRMAGQPLRAGRLMIGAFVVMVFGLQALPGLGFEPAAMAVLGVEALVGIGVGAARGATVAIYERDGYLWYRYRPLTVVVWLLTILLRVGMVAAAAVVGVSLPATGAVLVVLGVSLLAESAVVALRARRTGVPYAPYRRSDRVGMSR